MAKKNEKETAVAATPSATGAPPSYIEPAKVEGGAAMEGFENAAGSSMYSMLRLAQPSSKPVAAGVIPVGSIYDSLTDEVIVPKGEEVDVVLAYHYMSWIQWAKEMGKGIEAASTDPASALAITSRKGITREGSRKPVVTEYHNFVVMTPDITDSEGNPRTFLLSCSKTSYKAGKKLLMLARMKNRPLYAGVYTIGLVMRQRDSNTWFELEVANSKTNGGYATEHVYNLAKEGYSTFKAQAAEIQKQAEAALAKDSGEADDATGPASVNDDGKGNPKY